MNLKGGVIIIGSLYWDESPLRRRWRSNTFLNISKPVYTPAKIRYGRESKSRQNNYTMIFSNHPSTETGKALILEFKCTVKSFKALEKLAFGLAEAEGIYKKPKEAKIVSNWGGCVGLLLNPNFDSKDAKSAAIIREAWGNLYSKYEYFNPIGFSITKKEEPVISKNGILNIEWTKQMRDFDFLLAVLTQPKPQKQVTPRQIARRIIETRNGEYFQMNRKHKITTFQDKEIVELLKDGGFKLASSKPR